MAVVCLFVWMENMSKWFVLWLTSFNEAMVGLSLVTLPISSAIHFIRYPFHPLLISSVTAIIQPSYYSHQSINTTDDCLGIKHSPTFLFCFFISALPIVRMKLCLSCTVRSEQLASLTIYVLVCIDSYDIPEIAYLHICIYAKVNFGCGDWWWSLLTNYASKSKCGCN